MRWCGVYVAIVVSQYMRCPAQQAYRVEGSWTRDDVSANTSVIKPGNPRCLPLTEFEHELMRE